MFPAVPVSVPEERMPRARGKIPRAVQVQRYSDDINLTGDLSLSLQMDLLDESIHRFGNRRKVFSQMVSVAMRRHGHIVFGRNVDDAEDVGNACVLRDAVDCRDELVLSTVAILVVLAVLVAQIRSSKQNVTLAAYSNLIL